MLRDITLGQYYQTDSVIHRLDSRVKLVTTLVFIVSLFLVRDFGGYLLGGIALLCVIRLSRVPFKFMMRGMKAIIFLLVFAVVFNLFMTPGEPLVTVWRLTITWEGIEKAVFMGLRLIMLI
ncbi:MAG: energy-coupling factor transporter transmembrane protein EcfT, partial [Lachnospiraceae bacterium]|nr:energy-coupling factor transporter transmembrane protein EcfT [Lachnospiraceae bacterium]